ncbi:hypothetical protein MLD52_02895 [Puniceicoccaceae bacterium K14]|nr:hypothetical protein [Puniceicoccaceae bacterium K14]
MFRLLATYLTMNLKQFVVLFFAIVFASSIEAKKEREFIYLDKEEILQIVVIDNMHDYGSSNQHRYFYFESTLDSLFQEIEFPMGYEIHEFGARVPKNQPCIYITVQKWGVDRMGSIEVRLSAYLRSSSGNKNSLGIYYDSDFASIMTSGTLREKAYKEVLKDTLLKLLAKLEGHFPLTGEGSSDLDPLKEEEATE